MPFSPYSRPFSKVFRRPPPVAPDPSLSADWHCTFQALVVSLVLTRLDYGNSVQAGLPVYLFRRLQSVLYVAARLTYHLRRSDHISDAVACLHWLRLTERIEFKIAVLTSSTDLRRSLGPFTPVADPHNRRSLRSAGTNRLVLPNSIRRSTVGIADLFRSPAADMEWPPEDVTSAESLTTFRRLLKTHLFRKSFPGYLQLLDINQLTVCGGPSSSSAT